MVRVVCWVVLSSREWLLGGMQLGCWGGGGEVVKYCIMKNKYLLRLQGEVNITVILWNTSHSESTECVDLLHTENVLLTPLTSLTLKCS